MKKIILLLVVLSLSTAAIFAKSVDVTNAMQVAQNFYQQMTGKPVTVTLAYQCLNTDATNGLAIGEPIYYAFNVDGNKGFVMVSGDDLVKPILGYNTKGQFIIKNAPPVIADWYGKYARQIVYAKVNQTSVTQAITDQWSNYYNNVASTAKQLRAGTATGPLLQTTWDQDLYYNAMVPSDPNSPEGYGGNCPTGCGATAMSQIMKYWSYPTQGTGTNSYTSNYGTLSANFGATTYNWANMPNSVTSPNTDVATIMYDCGVAVDMVYGPDESTSYILEADNPTASCQEAYTTYFGYNPNTIQGLDKANYANESDWDNLIMTELTNNRPIQYAGQGPDGGHTFVLDGSDGNGNFHINWGWSGSDDGYYGIDALIPGPTSNGSFSEDESMVIGIEPLNVTTTAAGVELYAATTVSPDPIAFDQTFTVTTSIINNSTTTFYGSVCAALFDASGNFIRLIGDILSTGTTDSLQVNYYYSGLTFDDTTQSVTAPGTYQIGIFYQDLGATTWTLVGPSTYTNPITVTISGPTNNMINLYSAISASPTTLVQGQGATISVNLTNLGVDTFYGQYEVVLLDLQGDYVEGVNTYTESNGLPPNYDYSNPLTFSTNSITAPEGQYLLAVADEQSGTSNWYYCGAQTYQNPVLIDVINNGFQVGIQEISPGTLKVYPNPASNQITIDAGQIEGNYALKIFNTIGDQLVESNGILNGQKLSTDVSAFAAGMYIIQLKTESGMLNTKFIVR